jgi:hypothetical protein
MVCEEKTTNKFLKYMIDTDKIIELAAYTFPAIITGGVAYYLFQSYFNDQQHTRKWLLQRENQKQSLPLKLQAYERLALFLERINPVKLVLRVAPLTDDKMDYQNLLVQHIEQEYEHNLTQQIYVTDECWRMILTAKNSLIQNIRKTALQTTIENADKLREQILSNQLENQSATTLALGFLKSEVSEIM